MSLEPPRWVQRDGTPISCREKLRVLDENYTELAEMLRDTFEDAVLVGVDEAQIRAALTHLIVTLESPRKA